MTQPVREPLPDTRDSVTHKVTIETGQGPLYVYFTAGFYPDGRVGEVFVAAGKVGSTVRGLLNDIAKLLSYSLQYGLPLAELCERMAGSNYPPQGQTANPELAVCRSVTDYLFRWLPTLPKKEAGDDTGS